MSPRFPVLAPSAEAFRRSVPSAAIEGLTLAGPPPYTRRTCLMTMHITTTRIIMAMVTAIIIITTPSR